MEDELDWVDVTDLKQYHFCPRIVYFTKVMGVAERQTHSQAQGAESHRELRDKQLRRMSLAGIRGLRVKRFWAGIHLSCPELKLKGILDLVAQLEDGEWVVLEYKHALAPKKIPKNHLYQAAGYALLAERHFGVLIRRVLIYYGRSRKLLEFQLSDGLRNHLSWTIAKIRKIIQQEELPRARLKPSCNCCGYHVVCGQV